MMHQVEWVPQKQNITTFESLPLYSFFRIPGGGKVWQKIKPSGTCETPALNVQNGTLEAVRNSQVEVIVLKGQFRFEDAT